MSKIEKLFDEFFNSKSKSDGEQIIEEVLSLNEIEKAEFFHIFISNLGYTKNIVMYSSVLAKEIGKYDEFVKEMFHLNSH